MQRSVKQRLEALEALEAQAAAERMARVDAGVPDLDAMDEQELLYAVVLGLRNYCLHDGRVTLPPGCHTITLSARSMREPWASYYDQLVTRAAPLLAAHPGPFIPLAYEEVEEAIRLIDSGRVDVVDLWFSPGGGRGSNYRLRLDRCQRTADNGDEEETIATINHAVGLWAWQVGLPQVGDWEMTELHEWRAWLAKLLEPAPEA